MTSQSSVARRARGGAADDQAVLKAAARLTERDRYLIRLVAEHRVLTTDQLAALAFDNVITARHRLGALAGLGALRRFRPHRPSESAPWRYLLGPLGAALLGAEDRDDGKWLPQVRAGRQVALQRSQRLAHMIGANCFFVALAAHARQGAGELRTWLTGNHTTEFFYLYPISLSALASVLQPDGLGVWAEGGRPLAFMLEYDTGSEHLAQLAGKLEGYAKLAEVMLRYHQQLPLLLFCFLTPRREQTARRALAASADSLSLRIASAAIDPRVTCPAGQVWMPLHGLYRQVRLIDLDGNPFEAAPSACAADPYR
ncbi:MAG: replication-relaxation family protein [Streptosporangiaceae bacterium]